MKTDGNGIEKTIVEKAKELGASLAGIATVADLKASVSYEVYDKKPFYEEYKGVKWCPEHKSVLVWALVHPASEPALDWWSMKVPGFTPGNGVMRMQSRKLRTWLGEGLGISALSLPYQIEYGGAFLKDSAVLAGLGMIGKFGQQLLAVVVGPVTARLLGDAGYGLLALGFGFLLWQAEEVPLGPEREDLLLEIGARPQLIE